MPADLFTVAFEAGREARIAGKPRHHNLFRLLDKLFPQDSTVERTRLGNCWDAGWIFGERARRRHEAHVAAIADAVIAISRDIRAIMEDV